MTIRERDSVEEKTLGPKYAVMEAPIEQGTRMSWLVYLGAVLIIIGGLLSAYAVYCFNNGANAWSFAAYANAMGFLGLGVALVGLAHLAKRMHE